MPQMVRDLRSSALFLLVTVVGLAGCSRTSSTHLVVPPELRGGPGGSIADIAERCLPSVVNIASSKVVELQRSPFFNDPFFRFFFDHPSSRRRQAPREQRQRSLGSGVVITADGIVLTNNHVVDKADEIRVTTVDGQEVEAKVVGRDANSDLAVLRLKGKLQRVRPITFGNSDALRLGDVVIAIGNPFGVGQTVTMGIVSAKGRSNLGIVPHEDFIQTDAAINPGNSGGALINMRGELVGINTAIVSRSGGYQGVGFAIPSNMAHRVQQSILKHGKVLRGWLGIAFQDLTPDLANAMRLHGSRGALVSDVIEGSPAADAGIERGDVVLDLNGTQVTNAGHLGNLIASAGAGTTVSLRIARQGRMSVVEVQLKEDPAVAGNETQLADDEGILGGLTLVDLNDKTRRQYEVPDRLDRGAIVQKIAPGTPVAESGLRPGDVLIEINRQAVDSVRQFLQIYRAGKSRVLLLLYRKGSTLYLLLQK